MKRSILFLLSICVLLFSCSDGDDPVIFTFEKTNIDFTNEGGSESIAIESNVTWTAKSSASWCTVSPSSGSSSTTSITLSAPANEEYDNRSCTVTIESGNISKTITVNQGENLGLLVSQDRYELDNEESSIDVEVKANVEFEVEINDEWITQVETRGLTTSQIAFKIAKNDTYGNREGSITIKQKNGDMSTTITIFQSQEDALILSETEYNISSNSNELEIEFNTNIDIEVIIPEAAKGWVSYIEARALRTENVVLSITENKSEEMRSTMIFIKDKSTPLQETITINQVGNVPIPGVYWVDKMGTLGALLNQTQKDTITTMIVKGEINKADFDVMKLEMPKLKYIDLKEVKCEGDRIPDYAFGGHSDANKNISTIVFPESITSIGSYAFGKCSGLRGDLIIPNRVTSIGSLAFASCYRLTGSLILSDGLTTIGSGAFASCERLTGDLIIPDGVTVIRDHTFQGCTSFTGLILPDGLSRIGIQAFDRCSGFIGDLIIPYGVKEIGAAAFAGCSRFTGDLIIPHGIKIIYWAAFEECSGFTGDLIIPDGVVSIDPEAFSGCSGLTALSIGKNVTIINGKAFSGCANITDNVVFPATLISIGKSAFEGCYNVDAFQFPHTTPLTYRNDMLEKSVPIKVPLLAVSAYQSANGWKEHTIMGY